MLLTIILPAYNEEKALAKVLKSLPKKIIGIEKIISVVVDDGSSDQTYNVAQKYADYTLKHRINLGVGGATVTGIKFALEKINPDILITMDSDGQHDSSDIKHLIKPILNNKADVVIGSRLMNAKGMPLIKFIGNWLMNFFTYLFSGIWTTDSQTGMRAYNKQAFKKIKIKTSGYEYCSEVFREVKKHHLRFTEIPIKVIYNNYSKKKGQSIINSINILIKLLVRVLTG